MDTPLISILMSTYNETTKELDESINSIYTRHIPILNFDYQ